MSYASEVKNELTNLTVHRSNAKAELMALIRMNGSLSLWNHHLILDVQTENPAIAKRIYSLMSEFYHVRGKLIVRKRMKLEKNNLYVVQITDHAQPILADLGIWGSHGLSEKIPRSILNHDSQRRSYLRGAFLASGSVNNPKTSRYHLEIYSLYKAHNDLVAKLMNHYHLNAKTTSRRSGYITYLKEAEKIANFLQLIGATNSMLKFEDIRIVRDMSNSVNRLVNCENANMNKTADAATRQVANIQLISRTVGLKQLPNKLRSVAMARLKHQEVSLKKLGQLIQGGPISKSGINHRLRKINQYAKNLRENVKKA